MKRLRFVFLIAFMLVMFISFDKRAYAAGTIHFEYLDGTPLTATVATTDGNFNAATTEITAAGKTLIGFMDKETFTLAAAPGDYNADVTLVAVTEEDVDHKNGIVGGVANAKYFIYNNQLYITGVAGTVINEANDANAALPVTTSFSGSTFDIKWPSLMYDMSTYGGGKVEAPVTGEEITFAANEYYKYTAPTSDYLTISVQNRDDIDQNIKLDRHVLGTDTFYPMNVGWKNDAGTITDIRIASGITLSGNMNGLFNASFTNDRILNGDIGPSIYTSLKNIYFYCDVSQVTSAAGMFARIASLENIYVRRDTTTMTLVPAVFTNAKSAAYMFYGDTNLKNDTDSLINNMDFTSGVLISTTYMFGGCENIEKPAVSAAHFNMSAVKWARGMFFGAKNAQLVADGSGVDHDIKTWNLGAVVDASAMFSGGDDDGVMDFDNPIASMDPGLGTISDYGHVVTGKFDMSGWNMASVEMMGYMFSKNADLREIVFGASYPALIDASCAFIRCDYLSGVDMKTSFNNLKNTTAMFRGAGSLSPGGTADLSGFSAPSLAHADLMFADSGYGVIKTDGMANLSSLKSAAAMFNHCVNLTSLGTDAFRVGFGVLEDAAYMFDGDSALVKVDTSNWDMSKAVDISFLFNDCIALSSGVDVSNWGISAALLNAECFARNTSIAGFGLSGWDTSNVDSFAFAFAGNPSVTTITPMTSANAFTKVTTIIGMFADCPLLTSAGTLQTAPMLIDARGVYANDRALTTAAYPNLVKNTTKYTAYFMKNCESVTTSDISGWNTVALTHIEGMYDGCKKLNSFTVGNTVTASNVEDAGTMFRNCHALPTAQLKKVTDTFQTSSRLEDAYEMFKNCYAIEELDLSDMKFSACTELRRLAAMEENVAFDTNRLVTIKLSPTILTAAGVVLKDTDGTSLNMFWVDGDGQLDGSNDETTSSDDLVTKLFINGTPGVNILAYNFGGVNGDNDNRTFLTFNTRTINEKDLGAYSLTSTTDAANLALNVTSSFYTGGTSETSATAVPLTYKWTKDGNAITGTESKLSATKKGTYVATALPDLLKGSNSSVSATYVIGAEVVGITAKYTGPDITVGSDYSKDKVTVSLVDADGVEYPLTVNDFTLDSTSVKKKGDNSFTVTVVSGTNTFKGNFNVKGIRNIGSITASYSGPAVLVGSNYDGKYVTVTAYYTDDTTKKEGFEVTASSFSGTKVSAAGDNKFTVYYIDTANNNTSFSADFVVNGYKTVKSIAATYTGDKVKVGDDYNTDNVKVTLYYTDGTNATTGNFTVNTRTVTTEGGNPYTATYRDPFGNTYTAGFNVTGYKEAASSSASSQSQPAPNTNSAVVGPVSSTVVAPTGTLSQADNSNAAKTGTNTGVVQTGRTGKIVFYLVVIVFLIVFIVAVLILRKREDTRGKR